MARAWTSVRQRQAPSLANVKSHAEDLDDYLERLYDDDMNARVDATARIAALARRVENLPMLLGHDTLVQTLARVLREEGRKSVDLATNVVSVFFAFSNYSQFHPAILENQMGDATMRIVDLETKRHDDRLETIKQQGELDEFTERRLALAEAKQDRLLYVCFYMLLNLSEDPSVEEDEEAEHIGVPVQGARAQKRGPARAVRDVPEEAQRVPGEQRRHETVRRRG